MMTIGEVIEMLKAIFEAIMKYIVPLFSNGDEGEGEETTAEA